MSELVSTFTRRHLLVYVNRTKGLILMSLANVADDQGRARMTQAMLATDIGAQLPTIRRPMQAMQRDGFICKGGGRTYVILGVTAHDLMDCDHVECAAEAASIRRGATSDRKRAQAAARARTAREKRKREALAQR